MTTMRSAALAALLLALPGAGGLQDAPDPVPTEDAAAAPAAAPAPARPLLAQGPGDPAAQLGLALLQAGEGDLAGAQRRLADAQPFAEPELAAWIQRERERLGALAAVRRGVLERLVADGERFPLERDGRRAQPRATALEDQTLVVEANRLGVERVPLAEIVPHDLLERAKQLPEGAPEWLRAYAALLAGDARWRAKLPQEGGGAELAAQGEAYERHLRAGAAARALEELAAAPPPDAARAGEVLERVGALLDEHGGVAVVEARRPALGALARAALEARVAADPMLLPLAGKVVDLGKGRMRVVYEFEDPAEAEDFTRLPGAMEEWHRSMGPVSKPEAESSLRVSSGAFHGDGQVVYRHALELERPIQARYQMRYVPRPGDPELDVGVVIVCLAADGQGNFAGGTDYGDVYAYDASVPLNLRKLADEGLGRILTLNRVYDCELVLDAAGELRALREGQIRERASVPSRQRGWTRLFVHSPRIVAFERLELEGRPTAESLAELRERYVQRELAALGL